jgi:hypothetical protein
MPKLPSKILLVLLVVILSHSEVTLADPTISVGIGKGAFGKSGTAFERAAALGYEHTFPIGVFVRPELGWFMDISGHGKSSVFAAPLVGVRSGSRVGPEVHLAMGPGYLQNPDEVLGGHFQFSLEGGIAMRDENFSIGVVWKHLSSAGFNMPNRGRDFITAQVRVHAF